MSADEVMLNPPVGYGGGWIATLLASVVLLGLLVWWTRRTLEEDGPQTREDVLRRLRRETLDELEATLQAAQGGVLAARSAAGRMGAEVRRFVGIVSDGDADFTTLPDLKRAARMDARLGAAATFVSWLEPHLFGTGEPVEVREVHRRAVEVVEQWR